MQIVLLLIFITLIQVINRLPTLIFHRFVTLKLQLNLCTPHRINLGLPLPLIVNYVVTFVCFGLVCVFHFLVFCKVWLKAK
jgi:hypothetical protein